MMLALNVAPVNGHASRFGSGASSMAMATSGALVRLRKGLGQGAMSLQALGTGRIITVSDHAKAVLGSGRLSMVLYATNRMPASRPVASRFMRNVPDRHMLVSPDRSRLTIAAQHRRFIVA